MAKEIKFKIWWSKTKTMGGDINLNKFLEEGDGFSDWEVDNVILQYTGLKDKNGKEIYEGDILERGKKYAYGTMNMEVYWNQKGCGWSLKFEKFQMAMSDICNLKIIGNIYENQDLLK